MSLRGAHQQRKKQRGENTATGKTEHKQGKNKEQNQDGNRKTGAHERKPGIRTMPGNYKPKHKKRKGPTGYPRKDQTKTTQ